MLKKSHFDDIIESKEIVMVLYLNNVGELADYNKDLENAYKNNQQSENERIQTALDNNYQPNLDENGNADEIIIAVTKKQFFENKNLFEEKIKQLSLTNKNIYFVIDGPSAEVMSKDYDDAPIEYTYTKQELKTLENFQKKLNALGIKNPIKFNEYFYTRSKNDIDDCWDLKYVVKANNTIDNLVKTIREAEFSPYEAMIAIHKFATVNFCFGDNVDDTGKGVEKNSSIVSMAKFKKTVCVGFASFVKAVVDRLDNPNIKCQTKALIRMGYTDIACHALCLVDITDDKYKISGQYFEDPALDARKSKRHLTRGIAHCLHPISDLDYDINGRKLRFAKTNTRTLFGDVEWKDGNGIPNPTTKYWRTFKQGSPIPLKTTEKALTEFYSKLLDDEDDICFLVDEEMMDSAYTITDMLNSNANNPFLNYMAESEKI